MGEREQREASQVAAAIPAAITDGVAEHAVTFLATIPPTENAIRIHGEGGARLTLDIAENNMGAFLMVLPLRGKRLVVTLAEDE